MTRTTALRPCLTPEERAALARWLRAPERLYGEGQRARLVLLVADGLSILQAAVRVGLSRGHATTWLQRFAAQGLAGLRSRPRGPPKGQGGGRPRGGRGG